MSSAALLPEIGRQPDPTKEPYEEGLVAYVRSLAELFQNPKSEHNQKRAMAVFSLMAGTLQIARAVADPLLACSPGSGCNDARSVRRCSMRCYDR
jgi:hypothetical protein